MASKNHFYFPYTGNKRNEIPDIVKLLPNVDDITTIVEPFCGSSSFSYNIALLHPGKFKYVLNDNNHHLMDLYKLVKNKKKLKAFEKEINDIAKTLTKDEYTNLPRNTLIRYYIHNKIHSIRAGLFNQKYNYKPIKLSESPIFVFLTNEKITFSCMDGVSCYKKYKTDPKALIFMDPPYLMACNDFYDNSDVDIYQHLYLNKIENESAHVMLCLEWSWIIKLLFETSKYITYNKTYQISKKNTVHAIIYNKTKQDL